MSQEREAFVLGGTGGAVKFALEGNFPPVYKFLEELDIRAGIVRMGDILTNGHTVWATWTGTPIDVKELTRKSIAAAGGTGCLEIVTGNGNGEKKKEVFFREGHVIKTVNEPKGISPKQVRMRI